MPLICWPSIRDSHHGKGARAEGVKNVTNGRTDEQGVSRSRIGVASRTVEKYYNSCSTTMHWGGVCSNLHMATAWSFTLGTIRFWYLTSFFLSLNENAVLHLFVFLSFSDKLSSFGSSLLWITFQLELNKENVNLSIAKPTCKIWTLHNLVSGKGGWWSPAVGTGTPHAQCFCPMDVFAGQTLTMPPARVLT